MRLYLLSTIILLLLAQGCGNGKNETPKNQTPEAAPEAQEAAPNLWTSQGLAEARVIYERSCASCHDPGATDAPEIGVQEDWDGRSRMWVAVLTEHAKQGYLDMPARGGAQELTDKQVGAAAEYIMALTFPNLPLD